MTYLPKSSPCIIIVICRRCSTEMGIRLSANAAGIRVINLVDDRFQGELKWLLVCKAATT